MEILKSIGILLIGFIFLIKGADIFVEGSSHVAKKLRIPSLIIGLTIVAIGTSLPELSVSVSASLMGRNELSVSNVIGSNIFNLLAVLGFSSLFMPLKVTKDIFKRDYPLSIIITILLLIFSFIGMNITRIEGIIFIIGLIIYLIVVVYAAQKDRKNKLKEEIKSIDDRKKDSIDIDNRPLIVSIIFIIAGIISIKFGGEWVVNASVVIAKSFNISQNIIGLTIVAIGTSLPELATSVVAARKNELDISVGNVIGSNIFNILGVVGISAGLSSISIIYDNMIDTIILIVFSIITGYFCLTRKSIEKKEGIIMIIMYTIYNIYICVR